jgi:hypothetical protein
MIEAMKQALEALENSVDTVQHEYDTDWRHGLPTRKAQLDGMKVLLERHQAAITALRTAIEQAEEKKMPITDDHGKAIHDQRRVVEQKGNWQLIYDQHQIGNKVVHEFRIQKLRHDIALYPGITLEEAKQRFLEKVEADNE